MYEFTSQPTPEFIAAVEALKKLAWDDRSRAFAEATSPDLRDQATKAYGKPVKRNKSWKRLIGKRPGIDDHLPGDDHVELRVGKNMTYASHPYQLHLDQLRDIVQVCDENGLDITIDTKSWYFPSATLRVTYQVNSN